MGAANYDVVVVGAGAAGLSAAIGLAKSDISVLVLEGGAFPGAENWSGCVYFAESLADPALLGPEGVEALAWERRLVERGFFTSSGHAFAGATYRDPAAFRHCYTVLRPIFDHHLAQVARQAGATILSDTTVEGLIRERGRVIGVSTQRGPIYADLVFLAEGDASHLVTKEGYERETPGRQDPHFLQGVKQVIEMPPGAIEEIFGVGPEEGAAYEFLLRNGTLRGRETTLNAGGFLYTNRDSISLGFVLPLNHLNEGFDGDPNLVMEWLRGLPEIERWTRGGVPGVFGAKLIRGGGARDIPHLVDHGLAIGGAASAIGVDFPYPNFTGPATGMGLLLARAARAIRDEGGSFSLDDLKRHYLEPLRRTHWWSDVNHLRRWPNYVEKTRYFFTRDIDAMQGSLYTWTRPELGFFAKWREWARLLRRVMPPGSVPGAISDTRQMLHALGIDELANRRPIGRLLLDGGLNALRDLTGRRRPRVHPTGQLQFHFSVLGGREPVGPLPHVIAGWGERLAPVLSCAAREMYRNDPVPLKEKLDTIVRLLTDQINLLDVIGLGLTLAAAGVTAGVQAISNRLRRLFGRSDSRARTTLTDRWLAATQAAAELTTHHSPLTTHSSPDSWEDKLGRLSYDSSKDSHIKLFWPRRLNDRSAVAKSGVWHLCPAKVYECHTDAAGQVRLIVNHENCIKCESCWRATDLVDWARSGGHQLIYRVTSPAVSRLIEQQDNAALTTRRPANSRDWWAPLMNRVAQRLATSGSNGQFVEQLGRIEQLCDKIAGKLDELARSLAAEPRTIDENRARWIESLATYAKQLAEELATTVREGPLARAKDGAMHDVQSALVELTDSLQAKMSDVARRAYDRQFFWAAADGRQIAGHHLEGLRRLVRLVHGRITAAPPQSARWLAAEHAQESTAAFRAELVATLDKAFDRLAWRELDQGATLNTAQLEALRGVCRSLATADPDARARRSAALAELGRRDPSLAYLVASHCWATDLLRQFGGPAGVGLVERVNSSGQLAAFAWDGAIEIDRDDDGVRLRGQKIFVPTATAEWFVVLAGDQLIALPRTTPGLKIEPLGTIGMRGSAPATLVFDNVALPATRCRIDPVRFDQCWAVMSSLDLAAVGCGMAERLEARAIEHATSRVQFPGLFLDDDFRESIGKFGAVKKMLAQIGARRYLLETLVHQFDAGGPPDISVRRALELKIVAGDALGGHLGSITYNVTQIFGGTGYSEEDFLPKFYRDGSTLLTLGVPCAEAAARLGHDLLAHRAAADHSLTHHSPTHLFPGLDESPLFDEVVQRKVLQSELDSIRRARHDVESAVTRWQAAAARDPQAHALADVVTEAVGRRHAELNAAEAMLLRTHARVEHARPAECEAELLRTWLEGVLDAAHAWTGRLGDPDCQLALPSIEPPPIKSHVQFSYRAMLTSPNPYVNGDYLVKPFDPHAARYVPEMVPCDAELGRYDRELDDLLRARYRDRLFGGLSYERHVEQQHKLDPEDFDLFREHGFLRMYIPRELGGMGKTKAEYNLLVKNLIKNGDVGQTLTVQANTSIGTVPVLIGLNKELPKAKKEVAEFLANRTKLASLTAALERISGRAKTANPAEFTELVGELDSSTQRFPGSSPALRVLLHDVLAATDRAKAAIRAFDGAELRLQLAGAIKAAESITPAVVQEYMDELGRRVLALTQFQQWIAAGQMTVFGLTEPSSGSDTARVATRAVPQSVEVFAESDGSFRFTPAGDTEPRRVIDARRLEFRPQQFGVAAFYRWSDRHEPARVMFDEYDYESDDSDRPRYYMAGPVKVPFHDFAQIRPRDGKLFYDYWELNGAKMWMTNGRMAGVLVIYARTKFGVTSFYVDRHAEGLLVGKNEEKMGQKSSVTNELGLQSVRVPRENVNGVEGRGQVNALEALNAGRSGLTTSNSTSMDDIIARAELFARTRHGQLTAADRDRLEEMAELRYVCQALAHELVGRADHKDTGLYRVEPSMGKMLTSELLMRVIELSEQIHGLAGHTTLYNLEKHKRDHRIITVYEGANDVQRSLILKDLVRDIAGRTMPAAPGSITPSHTAGSERLHAQRGMLEEMKRELARVLGDAVTACGDEIWQNPGLQSTFFRLSDAAAFIKLADSALGRAEWVLRSLDARADAAYRDWTVRITRRIVARIRLWVRQCLTHVTESMTAIKQASYPPEIRAAGLMMAEPHDRAEPAPAAPPHEVSRPMQIVVIVEPEPTISPRPSLMDGRWREVHYRLDAADAAAVAAARSIAASATAPARVVVVAAGPRRTMKILEESLAAGADEAILIVTDDRPLAPESTARAIARAIELHGHAPDLILARQVSSAATAGLAGMLVARQLGLEFIPHASAVSVRFTDDLATVTVWTGHDKRPRRLNLPATLGIVPPAAPPRFRFADFLAALERPIKVVPWPEEIDRRIVRLISTAGAAAADGRTERAHVVTPLQAADVLLDALGLKSDSAGAAAAEFDSLSIRTVDRWSVRESDTVLVIVAADESGRLRAADRRAAHVASALARQRSRSLVALALTSNDDGAAERTAGELVRLGARMVVLASTTESPAARKAPEFWARILTARWSPEWSRFPAIVAASWAEPVLARFGARQAELFFRVTELAAGPRSLVVRSSRVEGKVVAERELPAADLKPLWITVTDSAECPLPPLDAAADPRVERWSASVEQLPGRAELLDLLDQVRDEIGVPRLADADFIIDVGYGVGSADGFEEVVRPLEKLLVSLGVTNIVLGGSRKVTEELKVLTASQQIGQTGQSVNPAVLLAIGISGAPQHLNYIGGRATILAFNRDPESPIMTLNQRQPRPRVFPIVGDLFQTVPALMAALREHAQAGAESRETVAVS